MGYLAITILFFSLVQLTLQYSLFERKIHLAITTVVISTMVYFMHYRAIEQSYASLGNRLTEVALMVNLAVLQVFEAILGILLSISLIRKMMGEKVKKWINSFVYLPGIIWFFALFYGESYLFFIIRTNSFSRLALGIAVGTGLLLVLSVSGFKWLIHEFDLRCEIKFFLHIVQIVLASALYISITGLPVEKIPEYGSLINLAAIVLLLFLSIALGYFIFNYKMKKIFKQ